MPNKRHDDTLVVRKVNRTQIPCHGCFDVRPVLDEKIDNFCVASLGGSMEGRHAK
jgi:hypothetical protein